MKGQMQRWICLVLVFVMLLGNLPLDMGLVQASATEEDPSQVVEVTEQTVEETVETVPEAVEEAEVTVPQTEETTEEAPPETTEQTQETTSEVTEKTGEVPREAYDAVDALFAQIDAVQDAPARKKADQDEFTEAAIAVVENSALYVDGSLERKGDSFSWWTTEGIRCVYDPRMREIQQNMTGSGEDQVSNDLVVTKGGTNSSAEVFLIGPYYGYDDDFTDQYKNTASSIATALGDTSGYTLYSGTAATVDKVAYAVSNGAVVLVDTHGATDYSNGDDCVTGADNSYICLNNTSGLTYEDYSDGAGYSGSTAYINGQTIVNHMTKNSPSGLVWLASCLGMATNTLCNPLRSAGVEVVYGYSQSVTFAGDYLFSETFWDEMLEGATVKDAIATMKNTWGYWDFSDKIAQYYGYSSGYSTISAARADYCAFPVVVSDEDAHPGQRSSTSYGACSLQTVKSTYKFTMNQVGVPEETYYNRVASYLQSNGVYDSGSWVLSQIETNGTISMTYSLESVGSTLTFVIKIWQNDNPNRVLTNTIETTQLTDTLNISHSIDTYTNGSWEEYDGASGTLTRSSFTREGVIDVVDSSDNVLEWSTEFFNISLQMALGHWDRILNRDLGFGLEELGFSSYNSPYLSVPQQSGLYYYVLDDQAIITKYDGTASAVTIPATIQGYPVTKIDKWAFFDCPSLKSVVIPDGVTLIGDYAFYACRNLTAILLPTSVTQFGKYAFEGVHSDATVFYKGTVAQRLSIEYDTDDSFYLWWHYEVTQTTMSGSNVYQCAQCGLYYYTDGSAVPLMELELIQAPIKRNYAVGDWLDLSGIIMEATYPDGTTVTVSSAAVTEISEFEFYSAGRKTIWVTVGGLRVSFVVYVHEGSYCTVDSSLYPESAHNYANNSSGTKTFTYPGARNMEITFSTSTEVENKYDKIYVYDGEDYLLAEYTGTEAAGQTLSIPGDTFKIKLTSDSSVTKYGYSFSSIVAYVTSEIITLDSSTYPQSAHNYSNNASETKTFTYPGASSLNLTFSTSTYMETNYDFVYLYDGNDNQIGMYTGSDAAGLTVNVTGDTFKIKLTSDGSVNKYGYSFTSITAQMDAYYHPPVTIPGTATCTQGGLSDYMCCEICGMALEEQVSVGPLGHNYVNGVCTACGSGMQGYYQLTQDMCVDGLSLTKDLYIDLNGYDMTGTLVTNGYAVYGLDSTTNTYACDCMGTFSCLDENGESIVPVRQFRTTVNGSAMRYMAIETEEGYTFHRFFLGITHINLVPSVTGFGYKAQFCGDAMVRAEVQALGYDLWLDGCAVVSRLTGGFREQLALRVRNFDAQAYGETPVHACVTMILNDGTVIESLTQSADLRSTVETVNENYAQLNAVQMHAVAQMILNNPIMENWQVDNLQ